MSTISHSDEETLSHIKQTKPSKFRFADEAGPSNAPPNTTIPSTPETDTTNVTNTPSSDDIYTDTFNFALSKIFSRTLMAGLTRTNAILKEVRNCINTNNEKRCRQISPNILSYWKDLHVKNGCACKDKIATTNLIKDAYIEAIHATQLEGNGMTEVAIQAWWPYMHSDLISKMAKCNLCVKIGENLKSLIPSGKWVPLRLCEVSKEKIQISFAGPNYNEKDQEIFFLLV